MKIDFRHICSFLALLCILTAPAAVRADTFTYTFTDVNANSTASSFSFSYTGTALLDNPSSTSVVPADCTVTGFGFTRDCKTVALNSHGTVEGVAGDRLSIITVSTNEYITDLPASFFTSVGTHADASGNTLTITDVSSSAVPEPSSLALLGTGIVGVCGFVRRRLTV